MTDSPALIFALVLSGGGARGAYEAGVIDYIRRHMPPEIAREPLFKIYSGTSVGAINTAFMAASASDPLYQGTRLRELWGTLRDQDIYHTDTRALTGFLIRSGFFMGTNFFGLSELLRKRGGDASTFPFNGVLNTSPFVFYLRRNVAWPQIHRNIERRVIDAVTVSTTHMMSGRLVLFVEKHPEVALRSGGEIPIFTQLSPKHILASAAIPLIFPIIRINREFYGDGSMRQNTPMSPAIHLGANRILVVAVHKSAAYKYARPATLPFSEAEPTVGDIVGKLMDSLFLDRLEYDLEQMRRINFLLRDLESIYGWNALEHLNEYRTKLAIPGKQVQPIRHIQPFVIAPTEDIGRVATYHFRRMVAQRDKLTPVQKFFARAAEGSPDAQNDLVSYLMFEPGYLHELINLGFEDARREHDRLVNFFSGRPLEEARPRAADMAPGPATPADPGP
ncbi:MAG: patatin-like phospholipase family protein [Candidatus Lambdaproteobacteria bacterium]|nr:patatin-like phospholipase family protein [Candidatus Lambdaproteobacteria bacterium]